MTIRLEIRTMSDEDIALGMRLKQEAGWIQTTVDWRRALELEPAGCFVAVADGAAAGTTTVCRFGPIAWIAMVLVDERLRGQGIGKALLQRAIDYCDASEVASIRLDATPLGRPLYEKLGFTPDFELARYGGVPACGESPEEVEPLASDDWPRLRALDRAVTGTDRTKLLTHLLSDAETDARVVRIGARTAGFSARRRRDGVDQLGPCLGSPAAAEALLCDALVRSEQPVVVDVPLVNSPAIACVSAAGLVQKRSLWRMTRGRRVVEQIDSLWASFGPEKG
jgi:GNAT superfamily N-acetyltransferase